ncbi:hypothetical protein N7447_001390 [Penicillium robsamsonii]|uniref:uncharacterized protein n=1 Tax=Penicillium robsamsonii TaxID=1792511 RepID=UPI002547247F|nr:uncharacterized protein N7447_001390 [Penicillium robsamsonii]KAJ5835364.1 hypothetical protein N7447_001390 [Penicillium robsamsonii]
MSSSVAATSSFSQLSAHSMGFCSTSSTSSPFDGPVTIDKTGFLQSALRAGGPYLCSLPAHTDTTDPHYDADTVSQIEGYAAQVLRDLHLRYQDIGLMGRHSKVEPEPKQVTTVLVRMPNVPQPELWYRAAKQINRLLTRHGHPGISVEMIETDLFNGIYCSPVESSHSISPKWKSLAQEIVARCPNKDDWTGLDCFRYGTNPHRNSNPVTVIIRVCKTSQNSFVTAARYVHGILAAFGEAEVDVLFTKDGTKSFVLNPILPPEATSGSVYPGVSIGIHNSSAGCFTLGGFVQLRFKHRKDWNTYALTCFHCVCPPPMYRGDRYLQSDDAQRAFERWERHPLTMHDSPSFLDIAKRILRIDHPAPRDLRTTINSLNRSIRALKDDSFYASKAEIDKGDNGWLPDSARYGYEAALHYIRDLEKRRDRYAEMLQNGSYYLGHVVAGSGMNRTRLDEDKRRVAVDWALIQISSNRIHRQMHGDCVSGNNAFQYSNEPTNPRYYGGSIGNVLDGLNLYKSGRSTAMTASVYHGLESVELERLKSKKGPGYILGITWVSKMATPENSFPFAEHGDSGAWITRMDGKVFGILTGGDERQGTTYFSRINDVFDDIKDVTGAVEVRIAPVPVSATVVLGSAVVADLSTRAERGKYIGYAGIGIALGPTLGPVIGGLLNQFLGWRSIFWFLVILSGVCLVVILIVFPETCRAVVGNGSVPPASWNRPLWTLFVRTSRFHNEQEIADHTTIQELKRRPNPFSALLIATQKEMGLVLLYGSILYAGYMAIISTLSTELAARFGFNSIQIGLCYLPMGIGSISSRWVVGRLLDWNFRREAQLQGMTIHKNRQQEIEKFNVERARLAISLPLIYLASFCILAYGWVMQYRTALAGPLVMLFFTGLTTTSAFNTLSTLVIDINYQSVATAAAANNLFRCLMGAGATAIAPPLIKSIGIGWTATFIAGLWVLGSPAVWIVFYRGYRWRRELSHKGEEESKNPSDL